MQSKRLITKTLETINQDHQLVRNKKSLFEDRTGMEAEEINDADHTTVSVSFSHRYILNVSPAQLYVICRKD